MSDGKMKYVLCLGLLFVVPTCRGDALKEQQLEDQVKDLQGRLKSCPAQLAQHEETIDKVEVVRDLNEGMKKLLLENARMQERRQVRVEERAHDETMSHRLVVIIGAMVIFQLIVSCLILVRRL